MNGLTFSFTYQLLFYWKKALFGHAVLHQSFKDILAGEFSLNYLVWANKISIMLCPRILYTSYWYRIGLRFPVSFRCTTRTRFISTYANVKDEIKDSEFINSATEIFENLPIPHGYHICLLLGQYLENCERHYHWGRFLSIRHSSTRSRPRTRCRHVCSRSLGPRQALRIYQV